jgi:hypothetical protein
MSRPGKITCSKTARPSPINPRITHAAWARTSRVGSRSLPVIKIAVAQPPPIGNDLPAASRPSARIATWTYLAASSSSVPRTAFRARVALPYSSGDGWTVENVRIGIAAPMSSDTANRVSISPTDAGGSKVGDRPIPKRIAAIVGSNGTSNTLFISYINHISLQRLCAGFFIHIRIKLLTIRVKTAQTVVKRKTGGVNPARFKSYRRQINRQPINRRQE